MTLLERLVLRVFPGLRRGGEETWIAPTVRASDVASSYSIGTGPFAQLYGRVTQYVLICATINARSCAAVPVRLMRRKRSKSVSPFGAAPSNPFKAARARTARLKHYRNPASVGAKAAAYAEYGDDVEEVPEHESIQLLQRPNPYMTGHDLEFRAYMDCEISGNAYHWVYREGSTPLELYPMGAKDTRVLPSEDDFITGYRYARDTSEPADFPASDVLHFRNAPSPFDPFYGIGPLQAIVAEADLAQSATMAEYHSWKNLRRPDFVIETTAPINPEQREQIKTMFAREAQGLHKRGAPMVMSQAKIVTLGFPPKDMEYLNGLKVSNDAILAAFGVPQSMVYLNDANLASSKTGHAQYYRQTVTPRVCQRAELLTEYLLPMYGVEPGEMWFAPDNAMAEDDAMDADRVVKLTGGGIMTVNEARSELGLPPSDDPKADELGSATPANANPFAGMGGGGGPSPFDAFNPFKALSDARDKAGGVSPRGSAAVAQLPVVAERQGGGVDARREEGRKDDAHDRHRAVRVDALKGLKFYGHHAGHEHPEVKNLPSPDGGSALQTEFMGKLQAWYEEAIGLYAKPDGAMMVGASDQAMLEGKLDALAREYIARFSGMGFDANAPSVGLGLDVKPLSSLRYLDTYVPKLVDAVTTDLEMGVRDAIASGLEQGMSTAQVTAEVQAAIPGIAAWKAERIARTESTNAYARGKYDAWGQSGIKKKQWLLSGNPCALCLEVAEKYPEPIPIDQPFFADDWFGGQSEPRHPQCACDTVAIQDEGDDQ